MNPRPSNLALAPVAGALLALATSAAAGPVLELAPVPGPGLTIAVRVRDIGPVPAAGWQAFLEFDPSRLTLVSGSYITTRFGLPLLSPIAAQAGHIDLAAGINAFTGQSPTADDQDLALLQFVPTGTGCLPQIRARASNPPTRLTDIQGDAIGPLSISSPWVTCLPDANRSGSLEVQDIFDFLNLWFAGDCRADFNGVGGLAVQDIFDFLNAWFAGCP